MVQPPERASNGCGAFESHEEVPLTYMKHVLLEKIVGI